MYIPLYLCYVMLCYVMITGSTWLYGKWKY